jgi:hypothetical protein
MGFARNTINETEHQPIPAPMGAVDCPAEVITRRIARALDKLNELELQSADDLSPGDQSRNDRLEKELQPIPKVLGELLEWTVPDSLAGVLGQVLQLSDVIDPLAWDDLSPDQIAQVMDRFNRLHRLIVHGLVRIGGLDAEALGVGHFTALGTAHMEAMWVASAKAA